jgi:predicted HTH transcriptional regulator
MDIGVIETLVTSYIDQSIEGLDKENPKFDFKAKWYDLKLPKDVSEFLKDTTSIVNTFGPDGYIVIGFDDKKKEFTQATFKNSNLRDSADIINLINGKVDRLFVLNTVDIEVRGNKLSVIHIPPSIDKPHVIKKYFTYENDGQIKKEEDNKIFVRKSSRVFAASKYDIDLMYYDRKNIQPEYELHTNLPLKATVFNIDPDNHLTLTSNLSIENSGRRPVAIIGFALNVHLGPPNSIERIEMISGLKYVGNNLLIKAGEIFNGRIELYCNDLIKIPEGHNQNMRVQYYNQERRNMTCSTLNVTLSNETNIHSEVKIIQ